MNTAIHTPSPIMPSPAIASRAIATHTACADAAAAIAHDAYLAGYAAATMGGRGRYAYAASIAAHATRRAGCAYREAPSPDDAPDAAMDAAAECIRRAWVSGYRAGCYAMGAGVWGWYRAMMADDAFRAGMDARAESWMMGAGGWAKYWPA